MIVPTYTKRDVMIMLCEFVFLVQKSLGVEFMGAFEHLWVVGDMI